MTKHVSSGGDATSSPRDAATESLPTRESADATDAAALEIEKLKLQLAHKNELLAQKERENAILRELADSLKAQLNAAKQAT